MKLLIVLAFATLAAAKLFNGDQVLTLYPKTPGHLRLIKEFDSFDTLADFWSPDNVDSVRIGGSVDIRFKSSNLRVIKKKLTAAKMEFEVKIGDLQSIIDKQFNVPRKSKALFGYDYDVYHTYDEINNWAKDVASEHPSLARHEVLINSEEGREIPMLTLGSSTNNPIFLIDCGIHAREWISTAFCQCFVNRMVSQYGVDSQVTEMMDKMTWVVMPLLNADGYAYTWTDDRMWRKTRTDYGNFCIGVDPNRNFDAGWGGEGASPNSCSETYYGPEVESEQLTKGLSNFIRANDGKIKAYITFHSYSQVYIYPYSYAVKDVDNLQETDDLAAASAAALRSVNGKRYTWGSGWNTFYLAAGGSDDMGRDNGINIVYTIELRDTGRYGFVLPEDQINPTCQETYAAVDVIAQHVM